MLLTPVISQAVKDTRHRKQMNQTEFGKLIPVKQSQVARWESGDGKSIPDTTWEILFPIIKDELPDDFINTVVIAPRTSKKEIRLPLPVVIQMEDKFSNYTKKDSDRIFEYGPDDMEPTIPSGSRLLVQYFDKPKDLPEEYIPMVQMRIDLPHDELVVCKWEGEEEFQIRRIKYEIEGSNDWYSMYLCRENGHEKDAIKLDKGAPVSFYGFVRALIKTKVTSTGFID